MIANLGMYDMPELHTANDAFWSAIRAALGFGPTTLTRTDDMWPLWQSPDLLFAQTCGYPYRAVLHGTVTLVGTPDYGLPDCPPGHYASVIVTRAGEDPGPRARFAYNEALSQSGWAAPMGWLLEHDIRPASLVQSGGHAKSAARVADGTADLAGLDLLTYQLMCEHAPSLTDQLRVLAQTDATPTLPYITAQGRDAEQIAAAVSEAIAALDPAHRDALHLRGFVQVPAEAYLSVATPPGPDAV